MMPRPTYYEARRYLAKEKCNRKIRIRGANTTKSGVESSTLFALPPSQYLRLCDYLDELQQQAIWDAQKCANQ